MQFWAICIVCIYVGIGLFNWVSGLHWLAEFSLPLSVLGGLGLAIASSTSNAPQSTDASNVITSPSPSETDKDVLPSRPAVDSSISFTINKNVRPQ
ncbi:MAG: hypothetical protein ACFB2W_06800 [Leptolyngbyaceae cyanobacterium]